MVWFFSFVLNFSSNNTVFSFHNCFFVVSKNGVWSALKSYLDFLHIWNPLHLIGMKKAVSCWKDFYLVFHDTINLLYSASQAKHSFVIITFPFFDWWFMGCLKEIKKTVDSGMYVRYCGKVSCELDIKSHMHLEPLCSNKWQKKVPVKKLVWGIGDVWRFWMIPSWS
jgi:hypothetical protein